MGRSPLQLALLSGLALAGFARAQPVQPDQGPVIVGPHESWKDFELERMDAALDFLGQYQSERRRQTGVPDQTNRETDLRETLDLGGQASIGHRNLLDLTFSAQLGLEDRFDDSETDALNVHESDAVNLYDVRALILGNGPAPVTLYSRREQDLLDRAFAGSIQDTLTESGAILQIQSARAPTTLQYFHREQTLSDPLGGTNSTVRQDTFTGQSGIAIASNQHLDLNYTFDHIEEDQPGILSDTYDRHDANIVHTLDFGPDAHPHELRSSLRIYDQGGHSAQEEVRWDELLTLRHSERLETRYELIVDQQRQGGDEQRLYRGEVSVRHHLFESLTSTASVGAQRLEAPGGFDSDDLFTSGQLDYTKQVLPGRLDAAAGASFDAQHNSALGGTLGVINESHVLNSPFPIVLPRRNIVPGSIVVTPPSGFPPYVEGVDYTVHIFPDRAELTVPPGSAILDGQTVLASYDVGPEPANDINTTGTTLSFRYTLTEGALDGLAFYTTYLTVDHSLNTQDPSLFVLDDVRDLLLGIEYNQSGLDLKAEHEVHDSTVSPFNTDRLQALYQRPLGRGSALSLEMTHEIINYTLEADRVVFDRATGRWDQRLGQELSFNLRLEYVNQRDDLAGNSEGFDEILGFTWHRGQTTVYGSVRNGFLNATGSDSDSQLFQLGVRRAF